MFLQKFRKTYDCIHWRTNVMTHIKEKSGFCFTCLSCFFDSSLQFLFMDTLLVTPQYNLQITFCQQCRNCQRDQNHQPLLKPGDPSIHRSNLKIPGIIRYFAGNLQCIFLFRFFALCEYYFLICIQYFFPYLITVACILQFTQFCLSNKFIPVNYQNRKSPELFFSRTVFYIDRIKQKCTNSSLYQFIGPGKRIFSTVLCQVRSRLSFRIFKHIKSDCFFIFLKRIYL